MKNCESDDRIDAYLLGRMSEEERTAFEEHYFNCSSCFTAVSERQVLISVIRSRGGEIFPESESAALPEVSRAGKFSRAITPHRWAYAAIAVALVLLVIGLIPRRGPAPPHFVLDGEEVLRGESLTLVSPSNDILGAPQAFEWKPLPDAAEYKVSLYDEALIWSITTKDSRSPLPEEIKAKLVPGRRYSWQVKAFSPQGQLLALSAKYYFQVASN